MLRGDWWRRVTGGRTRPLVEVDLVDLGVHGPPSVSWVERPDDLVVDRAVGGTGPLVVVTGPPLSGKSHTLARAARTLLGDHVVHRPHDPYLADLSALIGRAADPAVVWLDDASPVVLEQITPALLAALPPGVRLLVTVPQQRLPVLSADPGTPALLSAPGTLVRLPAHEPGGPALAGIVPALAEIESVLLGESWSAQERALFRVAVDADRLGWPGPLSAGLLSRVADLQDGVRHAETGLALVRRRRLAGRPGFWWTGRDDHARPHAHPLASAVADANGPAAWTPHTKAWVYADAEPALPERHAFGRGILARGLPGWAGMLLRDVDPATVPPAIARDMAARHGHSSIACRWWRRALDDEDLAVPARLGLGAAAESAGRPDAAREHYLAVSDDPAARTGLARVAEARDDLGEARRWHRAILEDEAAEGRSATLLALARLADRDGEVDEARAYYDRARTDTPGWNDVTVAGLAMEMRLGAYDRARAVLEGPDLRTHGRARLLLAAVEILDGSVETALARLDEAVRRDATSASDSTVDLLEALLVDPGLRQVDQATLPAARALARDPELLTLATEPVSVLHDGLREERDHDNTGARLSYDDVLHDASASTVLVGIARYLQARQHVLVDRGVARRYRDALLRDANVDLQALGRVFAKDFDWAMDTSSPNDG